MIKPLLALSVSLFLASCCTKKECANWSPYLMFYGFSASEIDTIYESIDGGTPELVFVNPQSDSSYSYSTPVPHDEKFTGTITISIPGAGKEYVLSHFIYERDNCNTCFPPGYDKFDFLTGFSVNGKQYKNTGEVDLYK